MAEILLHGDRSGDRLGPADRDARIHFLFTPAGSERFPAGEIEREAVPPPVARRSR